MPIKFKPLFSITSKIAANLIRIEAAKQQILHLPMTPKVLANLRETARLFTTHYSTMIEGNRLDPEEIKKETHELIQSSLKLFEVVYKKAQEKNESSCRSRRFTVIFLFCFLYLRL